MDFIIDINCVVSKIIKMIEWRRKERIDTLLQDVYANQVRNWLFIVIVAYYDSPEKVTFL